MDTRFSEMTFREVLVGALKNLTGRIFVESQRRVPVKTGQLKSSGSVSYSESGNRVAEINYSAPYAETINQTNPATSGKIPGYDVNRVMTVKEHKRTYPSGKTVIVREHEKNVGPRAAGRGNGFLAQAVESELKTFVKTEFPDNRIQVKELGL